MKTPRYYAQKIIFGLTPPCEDITHLVSVSYDIRLSWWKRMQIRVHTLFCVGCRRFVSQIETVQFLLSEIFSRDAIVELESDMPNEVEERLEQRIAKALEKTSE